MQSGARRQAPQFSGESPGFIRNQERREVLDTRNSERTLFGRVDEFETRVKCLNGSQLWRLTPLLDSDGILRVGGRLGMSNLPYEAKHPVVLPKKHHISKLVVAHIQEKGHHSLGVNATLADL